MLSAVSSGYATLIAQQTKDSGLEVDVIFGPAYKGIPLAATTSLLLYRDHGFSVGFAYDRKEAKDHGEGGRMVGADVRGKRVLILDDVMTAGTAVRQSIELIRKEGGTVVGVVMLLDREETGPSGQSTFKEIETLLGGGAKVRTIVRMRDLISWLESNGHGDQVQSMREYWEQYGIKESTESQ